MSVKTIFKTLIGTIVVIVISSMIIELFNINVTSAMLNQETRLAVKQSCVLFTQETYRNAGTNDVYTSAGSVNQSPIYTDTHEEYSHYFTNGGTEIYMNKFYVGSSEDAIWKSLYVDNNEFKYELSKMIQAVEPIINVYSGGSNNTVASRVPELESLRIMSEADRPDRIDTEAKNYIPSGNWWDINEGDADYPKLIDYNNHSRAYTYMANRYTPINVGIPYMDKTVTSKMLQWHLTQLLTNNNPGSIQKSENATSSGTGIYDYYVNFRGFAVYTRGAQITGYKYHICDLDTADGRKQLQDLTGMQADPGLTGIGLRYNPIDLSSPYYTKISNNLIFVVEVEYQVPVTYIGITPLKDIFNFVFNNGTGVTRAEGFDGANGTIEATSYQDGAFMLTNVDDNRRDAQLAQGKVYYTLVR